MRYLEIINEAATAPLYHGTTFSNAVDILTDGAFRAFTTIGMDGKAYFGISTSRSPRMSHIDHDPAQKAWEKDTIEGFNVIFVIDQNKIRQKFKIIPFDFFKGSKTSSYFNKEVNKLRDARSESEEFIVIGKDSKAKLPLHGHVSKIVYFPNSFKNSDDDPDVDTYLKFKKLALLHSIPVILNYTLFGFEDNERPWDMSLRQSMVTHPDKNEVKIDPRDFEIKTIQKLEKKYEKFGSQSMTTDQLDKVFSKGDQVMIWNFWTRMNGRFPSVPGGPISDKVYRVVFNSLKKADPKTNTIYRKITPFVAANAPQTPEEKKAAGLKKVKSKK